MRYGVPYKGSKNALVEKLIPLFPKRKNFYDLFCGGCAVTHGAMLSGRFQNFTINDIDPLLPQLFWDAVHGKYRNENRWISREEFYSLKDSDGYVKLTWSFGNNGRDYLYGKPIEAYKKAIHYLIFFRDTSLILEVLKNRIGETERFLIDEIAGSDKSRKDRYHMWRAVFRERLQSLESLESLERLESLESLERLNKSYDEIEIKPDSLIYCDIPYRNTDCYNEGGFNHDKFYEWALRQKELTLISEYNMPESDFKCVAEFEKRCTLSASANNLSIEKLFVPKTQLDLWLPLKIEVKRYRQLEFNFD
jgi:site-specific DNA-adenine methylase